MESITAIIPAAGRGQRMGAGQPKQYLPLGGRPVLWHVLAGLEASPLVADIVLVVRREDMDYCRRQLSESGGFAKVAALVPGGAERSESVYRGLQETRADMVLIHDAVRPFISAGLLERVVAATREHGAALPALPVVETIKEVADDRVVGTPHRERLWQAQTPQGFDRELLLRAYHAAGSDAMATDDAALVERLGHTVCVVPGEADNRKLTTPEDLAWAEWRVRTREEVPTMGLRIGQGYDVHRLEAGRPLILGGVVVPFDRGLAGHSDADVLTHAIIDALLGALAAGDIGQLFPDSDAQYKDISSLVLLKQVGTLIADRGARVLHIDAVVAAEQPKLAPHLAAMRQTLATTLGLEMGQVSLKATTTEHLGFVGREEGMEAQAVALLAL